MLVNSGDRCTDGRSRELGGFRAPVSCSTSPRPQVALDWKGSAPSSLPTLTHSLRRATLSPCGQRPRPNSTSPSVATTTRKDRPGVVLACVHPLEGGKSRAAPGDGTFGFPSRILPLSSLPVSNSKQQQIYATWQMPGRHPPSTMKRAGLHLCEGLPLRQ
jgi:hypothetical protein